MSTRRALSAFSFVAGSCLVMACGGTDDPPSGAAGSSSQAGRSSQAGSGQAGSGNAGTSPQAGTGGNASSGGSGGGSAGSGVAGAAGAGPRIEEGRLAAGSNFACGIGSDQAVVCWGSAPWSPNEAVNAGQAWVGAGGDSKCTVSSAGALRCRGDVLTPPAGTFSSVVVSSNDQACALTTTGTAACWGASVAQWQKPTPTSTFQALAIGLGFACGINAQGSLECWGATVEGIPTGMFSKLYASGVQVCGIRADKSATCWGSGPIALPATASFTQLALGSSTSGPFVCGLDPAGKVTCFGEAPAIVDDAPTVPMAAIAAADSFVCGIASDGTASCWGTSPPSPPSSFKAF